MNDNMFKENGEILGAFIEDGYTKALDIMDCDDHRQRINEFHDIFEAAKRAIESARRESLVYASDTGRNFYAKGFLDGLGSGKANESMKGDQINKSDIYDLVNCFDDQTDVLESVQILLGSVCSNYFEKENIEENSIDSKYIFYSYREYSNLVRLANNLIFDLKKEYRKLAEQLLEQWKRLEVC